MGNLADGPNKQQPQQELTLSKAWGNLFDHVSRTSQMGNQADGPNKQQPQQELTLSKAWGNLFDQVSRTS